MPKELIDQYSKGNLISKYVDAKSGQNTGDNNRFIRFWYEVSFSNIGFGTKTLEETECDYPKWYPYNKGGEFRKWYGNFDNVVNWANNGKDIKDYAVQRNNGGHWSRYIQNLDYMLREGITWTFISSTYFGARYTPIGHLFDYAGCSAFPISGNLKKYLGYFCSGVAQYILRFMNPTLNLQPGNVNTLPEPIVPGDILDELENDVDQLVLLSKKSWDSLERSWDFQINPLLYFPVRGKSLISTYKNLESAWSKDYKQTIKLEERNKQRFINIFKLNGVVSSKVSPSEITLDSNPHYRFNGKKTTEELRGLLVRETLNSLISYAIGCMMGRYSLDHTGLIYAHSGNIDFDPSKYTTFPADDDGIIPIMDMDWFPDDATNLFVDFLKVAWPPETLQENLKFVADNLSPKSNEAPVHTIRRYLSTGFFKDHLKTYKKRPIYWLFSSGKQKAFECLVYLHRYNETTLSRMRSNYVTSLQSNIRTRLELVR